MRVINDNKLPTAPITEFLPTQGDLKFLSEENYKKLKANIERRGFDIPIYAWIDKDGQKWLLDGHQRKHVLTTEGWNNPIPYLVVKATDKAEAAERLLEITSQFGTITQEGIDEYIAKFELPEVDVLAHTNFDGIFNFTIEPESPEEPDEPLEVEEPHTSIRLNLTDNGEHFIVKATEGKKTNTIGSFIQWEEARDAAIEFLEGYEPQE